MRLRLERTVWTVAEQLSLCNRMPRSEPQRWAWAGARELPGAPAGLLSTPFVPQERATRVPSATCPKNVHLRSFGMRHPVGLRFCTPCGGLRFSEAAVLLRASENDASGRSSATARGDSITIGPQPLAALLQALFLGQVRQGVRLRFTAAARPCLIRCAPSHSGRSTRGEVTGTRNRSLIQPGSRSADRRCPTGNNRAAFEPDRRSWPRRQRPCPLSARWPTLWSRRPHPLDALARVVGAATAARVSCPRIR